MAAFQPVGLVRRVDVAERTRGGVRCCNVMSHRIPYASISVALAVADGTVC